MKRLITSAVALTLMMGGGALAQDRDKHKDGGGKHDKATQQQQQNHQGGGGGGGGGHKDRNNGGGGGDHRGNGGANPNAGAGAYNPNYHNPNQVDRNRGHGGGRDVDRRDDNRNKNWDRNRNDNRNQNWNRNDNRGQNWNRNDNRNNWNRGPRDRPRNFDRRHYQRNVWAQHRFRRGYYHRPPGWYYRRWTYGQVLPFAFFAQDYWLNDYYAYDLPVPPYGYEWVRYGDDAILVDVRTGMILQVMYGVFY